MFLTLENSMTVNFAKLYKKNLWNVNYSWRNTYPQLKDYRHLQVLLCSYTAVVDTVHPGLNLHIAVVTGYQRYYWYS